ncbi:MAG: helix-turn-helix domain-containing protein [Acidobacteria bacterium]|nr:helix-turn-helix domain-containing protein [Acidobacteriota bacterium]
MKNETDTDEAVVLDLGRRVARHRLNRDWTQERLAEEAGVSLPTVSRLERGESTSLVSFLRVLRALDLMRDLKRLVPEVPPSPVQELRTRKPAKRRASRRGR